MTARTAGPRSSCTRNTVPFKGPGRLTHRCVPQSELVVLDGAPHGCNVSHAREFNQALISFLRR